MPRVMDLIWPGAFVVQSIHVVARLGIADALGPEPRTADELAEAAQVDAPSLKRILRALTTLGVFAEDTEGRFRHTDLSQTLRAGHPESVRAWALMLGAHFVWRPIGDLYESVRTGTRGEEAVRIAETVDQPLSRIGAYRGLGYLYLRKGDLDKAIRLLERCRELCQAWNIRAFTPGIASYLGHAYVLSGCLTDGLPLIEQGIGQGVSIGGESGHASHLVDLSDAYRLANRIEDAIRSASQALDLARDQKRPAHQAWALRALGDIASHRDPPDAEKAEASYRQAMVLADELGMRPLVAHCHLGLGKLYGCVGRHQEASEHLATAAAMYREMDMRLWLEQAEVSRL